MIIDIAGARGAFSDEVYVGSPAIIKLFIKKVNNKYTKNLEFSTRQYIDKKY